MKIKNQNRTIQLIVSGYEFPDLKAGLNDNYNYDANWLCLWIKEFENGKEIKNYSMNCLLTYELKELISGLNELYNKKTNEYISNFMEPFFAIKINRNNDIFKLSFSFYRTSEEIVNMDTNITNEELKEIINDLKIDYYEFPEKK